MKKYRWNVKKFAGNLAATVLFAGSGAGLALMVCWWILTA